jgi:hypothetical protein
VEGCAHAQPEIGVLPSFFRVLTGNDVTVFFQTAMFEIQRYLCDVIKTFHFPVFKKK